MGCSDSANAISEFSALGDLTAEALKGLAAEAGAARARLFEVEGGGAGVDEGLPRLRAVAVAVAGV